MTTTETVGQGWRPAFGLRLRLLGWALVLLAVASLTSVVVVRQVLINQLENRTTADMRQEAAEFRRLANGLDPATGAPFGADLPAIADTYLLRNEPQSGEVVLIFVDGAHYRSTVDAPHDLTRDAELVSQWTRATDSGFGGSRDTPAGAARWLVMPITVDRATRGQVVIAQFDAERRAEIDRAVATMALACLLVIVVVAAGGYLAMGRALRPLRAVTETARTIEESDLSRRIEVTGSDEVADLARTFNAMVGRLQRAFATQRAFISDAGHELRTPITIVRGHLELMGDDPEDRRETVALVTDELDRMNRMVNDLLMLARAEQPDFLQPQSVELVELVTDVYVKATALGERDWRLGELAEVRVRADPQRLTQALMQLAQNAVQFTENDDAIEIAVQLVGDRVRLSVTDTGIGIAPQDQARIFERFARTDRSRHAEGAGLGLAIVAAIAVAHRGEVSVQSAPGIGSTFAIVLPLEASATAVVAGVPMAVLVPREAEADLEETR
ncbi:sensor histidine kinase [Micromonospora sp. NBC_01813]|uniref:sensor histidine kinase n=1 Tax=Micromonospora sp. NBC_01813 TaxID=2975988 RepID=UPI002DD9F015|nr:HAMP domain-containing sensor histidine kinase [Micromonospora sp. NBC_01813]WSA10383.1 HAMP domain-containing histidine kinase [Micromonospora sp. NBC_01813]